LSIGTAELRLSELLLGSVNLGFALDSVADDRLAILCPSCGTAVRLGSSAEFTARRTIYRCPADGAVVLELMQDGDGGVQVDSPAPPRPMAAVA
jgi:hypothetical protein